MGRLDSSMSLSWLGFVVGASRLKPSKRSCCSSPFRVLLCRLLFSSTLVMSCISLWRLSCHLFRSRSTSLTFAAPCLMAANGSLLTICAACLSLRRGSSLPHTSLLGAAARISCTLVPCAEYHGLSKPCLNPAALENRIVNWSSYSFLFLAASFSASAFLGAVPRLRSWGNRSM